MGTKLVKRFFLFIFTTISICSFFSIEIVSIQNIGQPKLPLFIDDRQAESSIGFAEISWISKEKILYGRNPLYWIVDLENNEINEYIELETIITDEPGVLISAIGFNAAVIYYGNFLKRNYLLVFENPSMILSIDQKIYNALRVKPTFDPSSDLLPFLSYDWSYELLGSHKIVPRPIYEPEDVGYSLQYSETDTLLLLPPDYAEFRGGGNANMIAVSFNKFRIAAVVNFYRVKETDPLRYGWLLFVMKVEYDGIVTTDQPIYSEPDISSQIKFIQSSNTSFKVIDADNYEKITNGSEDFWYLIRTETGEGWIFGENVIIENQNWQERIKVRGPKIDRYLLLSRSIDGKLTYESVIDLLE